MVWQVAESTAGERKNVRTTGITESAQRSAQAMQQKREASVSGGETGRMVP